MNLLFQEPPDSEDGGIRRRLAQMPAAVFPGAMQTGGMQNGFVHAAFRGEGLNAQTLLIGVRQHALEQDGARRGGRRGQDGPGHQLIFYVRGGGIQAVANGCQQARNVRRTSDGPLPPMPEPAAAIAAWRWAGIEQQRGVLPEAAFAVRQQQAVFPQGAPVSAQCRRMLCHMAQAGKLNGGLP